MRFLDATYLAARLSICIFDARITGAWVEWRGCVLWTVTVGSA